MKKLLAIIGLLALAAPVYAQQGVNGTRAAGVAIPSGDQGFPVLMGAADGSGILQRLTVDGSGNLNTTATISGSVTVSSGVAQGSTTSGQIGPLIQGAVTTASPSYTNGQTSPFSLTPSGELRIATIRLNGAAIDLGNGTTGSGTQRITISSDSTGTIGLAAGAAVIGHVINDASSAVIGHVIVDTAPTTAVTFSNQSVNVGQINGVTPLMGNGVTGTGSQRVTIASDNTAFSVNAVQSGTWTVQPGNTANTTPWLTAQTPRTSGGSSFGKVLSAGSTNKTALDASAGQIYGWNLGNAASYWVYYHFYNLGSGSVTVGTTVPDLTIGVPPGGTTAYRDDNGIAGFGTAITYAITKSAADNDATAVLAADTFGIISYK